MIVNFGRHLLPFNILLSFSLAHSIKVVWSTSQIERMNDPPSGNLRSISPASLTVTFPFSGYNIGMGPREVYNQTMVQMV